MPKETVRVESLGRDLQSGELVKTESSIHVGWDAHGRVQVGVERPDTSLWSEDMDWAQVNELIRLLRRARDRAFGRDE